MSFYEGKKVLITGGSSGIGEAAALQCAREGAHVAIAARGQERLDAVLARMKAAARPDQRLIAVPMDVTDGDSVRAACATVLDELGGLDVLVANQGFAITGYLQHLTEDDFDRMLQTNYLGHVRLVQTLLPHFMAQRSGAICLVSSMMGFMGFFGYAPYAASKHAVVGFARCLRSDLVPYGVSVTLAYPPTTETPGLEIENETKPPETWSIEGTSASYPPERVAASILAATARGRFEVVTGAGSWFIWIMMRTAPWFVDWFMDQDLKKYLKKKGAGELEPPPDAS